jgi:hypothetical protein
MQNRRNAFMLCVIHRSFNAALINYKAKMCEGNPSVNYDKTVNYKAG